MQKPLVLYIGAVRSGEYESLASHGIPIGAILDTNSTMSLPDPSAFCLVEYCNFDDHEEVFNILHNIKSEWDITCTMVPYERYVFFGALITERLGLQGLSSDAALRCRDKTLMHECFVRHIGQQSTAQFMKITSKECLFKFLKTVDFPIVLKPTNLHNSLFVSINRSLEELLQSYECITQGAHDFFRKIGQYDTDSGIQAEEFLDGTVHSVDCIVDSKDNVFTTPIIDILTGKDVGQDDFHHFARLSPSRLTADEQAKVYELAVAGTRSLAIRSSVAHIEIIYTKQGPKLLEIGARPGANRARILGLSYGIDLIYAYYQVRSGLQPDITAQKTSAAAIVSLYSYEEGTLTQINHLERITKLKTYLNHQMKVSIGTRVGPSTLGYTASASIELHGDVVEDVYHDVDEIRTWKDIFSVTQ